MPNQPPDDPKGIFGKPTKIRNRDQRDSMPTPESTIGRHEGTDSRVETIEIDGQKIPVWERTRSRDGGPPTTEDIEYGEKDVGGRIIPKSEIAGDSWTGVPTPRDCYERCENIFHDHRLRHIYLEVDGELTDWGVPLCDECMKKNIRNWNWYKYSLHIINKKKC